MGSADMSCHLDMLNGKSHWGEPVSECRCFSEDLWRGNIKYPSVSWLRAFMSLFAMTPRSTSNAMGVFSVKEPPDWMDWFNISKWDYIFFPLSANTANLSWIWKQSCVCWSLNTNRSWPRAEQNNLGSNQESSWYHLSWVGFWMTKTMVNLFGTAKW